MNKAIRDITVMSARCLRMTFRNSETIVGSTVTPAMLAFLFIYILGSGAFDIQEYVDAQVPGVIVVALGMSASYTAWSLNSDMQKGIIDRFRSMPLFQPSVLAGHVTASVARCSMTVAAVIVTALAAGYRPRAGVVEWIAVMGIMFLITFSMTWVFIFIGLAADSPEGVSSYAMLIQFIPFVSGGFTDPEQLILPLRVFFSHQPFTPIIEAVRGLTMNNANRNHITLAVIWCVALTLIFYALSLIAYKRKTG